VLVILVNLRVELGFLAKLVQEEEMVVQGVLEVVVVVVMMQMLVNQTQMMNQDNQDK